MYVCLCRAVSDRTVRQLVRAGARSYEDVQRATGAGTGCGSCEHAVRTLVIDELEADPSAALIAAK